MQFDPAEVFGDAGPIASRLEGWEARPGQIEMAQSIRGAMESRSQVLVEAGTGLGKSFAYLVPAIERVVDHHERVVVVTHTITLQEQLMDRDIPFLNSVLPGQCRPALVKGRGNYLSRRRLELAIKREHSLVDGEPARRSLRTIEEWARTTDDGTIATLPVLERRGVWDLAQSDSGNCLGRRCPTYDTCFFQNARKEMERSDLLVCNHALFFSDLALRIVGASLLPRYDHVIFDEAHAIEDVASEHFGLTVSERGVEHLLGRLWQPRQRKGLLGVLLGHELAGGLVAECIQAVEAARTASDAFFSMLLDWHRVHGRSNGRIAEPGIVANPLTPAMDAVSRGLDLLKARLGDEADVAELSGYAERAGDLAMGVARLLGQDIPGAVYWIDGTEQTRDAAGRVRGPRPSLRCMVVEVAPLLREHLFSSGTSIVMTSATLATSEAPLDGLDESRSGFNHIRTRLGCDEAPALQVNSPFQYDRQMREYVDRSMPAPSAPGHLDALVNRIVELVERTHGGAFVLFTSFRMLHAVADAAGETLSAVGPLFVQGRDGPPGRIIEQFRLDERSVLLGTTSFWQGVDVRGRGLRNVIITRLPFEVPDRPIVQARTERIEARGGSAFGEDQLPRAVIRFRQGIGRLIRSAGDEGIVSVLDPRIITKGYGRRFQQAIPEGVVIEDLGFDYGDC